MKTTFSRLFSMIAALLLLCLLISGIAFRFLMMSWVESEKRKSLSADASALADLVKAYSKYIEQKNKAASKEAALFAQKLLFGMDSLNDVGNRIIISRELFLGERKSIHFEKRFCF